MLIKCWGSRGSIPVSGQDYLQYGGDTTCIEIRTKSNDIIIIDAGTGIRRLGNHLIEEGHYQYHLILTHGHWDHIMGFPFFKPLLFKQSKLYMHSGPFHNLYPKKMLTRVMSPPNFPVKYSDIEANICYEDDHPEQFEIGSVTIIPISLSHPNGGHGYKFIENGKSFVFLTDNELEFIHPTGLPFESYLEFTSGADFLIHDAEFTPQEYETTIGWGHSVYTDALNLAFESGVGRLGLFHLNQERTDRKMDRIVEKCNQIIDEKDHNLDCFAVGSDMSFEVS
ncbi:MAG: MBL fold metallo-hydrolase [Desulfobacterales bacterium]